MDIPTISPEDLSTFHSLFAELKTLQEQATVAIEAAKTNADAEITIARDGKPVVLSEKALWDEVWHLGADCDAGTILSARYPDAFRLSREAEEKKAEMKAFSVTQWGIDPVAMTLSDIMRLMSAMIDYKLSQRA